MRTNPLSKLEMTITGTKFNATDGFLCKNDEESSKMHLILEEITK